MIDTKEMSTEVNYILDHKLWSIRYLSKIMKIHWVTAKNIVYPTKPWANKTIRKVKEFIKKYTKE